LNESIAAIFRVEKLELQLLFSGLTEGNFAALYRYNTTPPLTHCIEKDIKELSEPYPT
jgi:hypothetical protein